MLSLGFLPATVLFCGSFILNFLVLAYRSPSFPSVRRGVDRIQRAITGRPDWSWLRLSHLVALLAAIMAVNVAYNVATLHCADDSLAALASGRAVLHGGDPFSVSTCGMTNYAMPYGLAEVTVNTAGALTGNVLGIWIAWQLLALTIVPLVWMVGGKDRRYVAVLTSTSVLYLPNIATNIGVENEIVAVSVLVMLYALQTPRAGGGTLLKALAAFLSTARFPAVFPLLGVSSSSRNGRLVHVLVVVGVFLGAIGLSVALWGRDAVDVVYLGQFTRNAQETFNQFSLLVHSGWIHPSLGLAAVSGGGILILVLWVNLRRYSALAASSLPLLGVMLFSQYLTFHFVVWIVPVLLLGPRVNWALLAYGTLAYFDETVAYWYFALEKGIWWPYEVTGVVIAILLVFLVFEIVTKEEEALRIRGGPDTVAAVGMSAQISDPEGTGTSASVLGES